MHCVISSHLIFEKNINWCTPFYYRQYLYIIETGKLCKSKNLILNLSESIKYKMLGHFSCKIMTEDEEKIIFSYTHTHTHTYIYSTLKLIR